MRLVLLIGLLLVLQLPPSPIKARDAKKNVGKTVTVCGVVMAVRCAGPDAPMLLDLDSTQGEEGVTVEVDAAHRGAFGPRIEDLLLVRSVCATGVVRAEEKQRFPLAIERPEQVRVMKEPSPLPVVLEPSASRACDAGVQEPRRLTAAMPVFPASAQGNRVEGVTLLDGVVRRDGTVGDISIVRSSGSRALDVEAAKAFLQWTYAPGTRAGRPVPVVVTVQFSFSLR